MRSKITLLVTIAAIAVSSLFQTACESAGKNTAVGAGAGAAGGAVFGALLGGNNRGQAAAIGALVGGALGATIGNRLDRQQKELAKIAETKRTELGLVTKLKSDILFDTGHAELKNGAKANLGQMSAIMKKYPENVLNIKGYTDSTGSAAINKELSAKRASAVRQQLIQGGIPASTIAIQGMGPENPVAANTTKDGRAKNRRVEIEITVDETKVPKKG